MECVKDDFLSVTLKRMYSVFGGARSMMEYSIFLIWDGEVCFRNYGLMCFKRVIEKKVCSLVIDQNLFPMGNGIVF